MSKGKKVAIQELRWIKGSQNQKRQFILFYKCIQSYLFVLQRFWRASLLACDVFVLRPFFCNPFCTRPFDVEPVKIVYLKQNLVHCIASWFVSSFNLSFAYDPFRYWDCFQWVIWTTYVLCLWYTKTIQRRWRNFASYTFLSPSTASF